METMSADRGPRPTRSGAVLSETTYKPPPTQSGSARAPPAGIARRMDGVCWLLPLCGSFRRTERDSRQIHPHNGESQQTPFSLQRFSASVAHAGVGCGGASWERDDEAGKGLVMDGQDDKASLGGPWIAYMRSCQRWSNRGS